ncbi:MAG: hypothetical protein IT301_01375 [Dehalococcoidia bacterium]|nr:hypothetical protein [Dehalococcoidia bacterium]
MMRRPILPLGSAAPWVLALCAALLAVIGWFTGNREMVILAGIGVLAFVVGFPLARLLIGSDGSSDQPSDQD